VSEELKRALELLLVRGREVEVELEETLIEDLPLPEEVDWKLHAEVLHEWVPEALGELLSEAGVRNPLIRHLKDDIQAPEYIAEGVAELGGCEVHVAIYLDVLSARAGAPAGAARRAAAPRRRSTACEVLRGVEAPWAQPCRLPDVPVELCGGWWRVSEAKLFGNSVLEAAARSSADDFGRAYFVFRALRPPDIDLLSAVLLGDAFTERILAALHGRMAEEERLRRERVLERALVALFRDYVGGGFEAHHYAFFRYLWSVRALVHYPWCNYVYGVEEPVEVELVEEVWAYPSGFYERAGALAFKYRVLIVDAWRNVKTVEKAGARVEILSVRGPEPYVKDDRVEAELNVRGGAVQVRAGALRHSARLLLAGALIGSVN